MRFAGRHCKTLYNYPNPDGGFRLISLLHPYSTVHTVIKKLQDEAIDPQSLLNSRGAPRKQELMLLIKNLEEVLKELDEIIRRYQGPARRQRRIWNQFRLATENLDRIRSKLIFHVTAINAFTSSLSCGTLAQIETVLVELVSEVPQGRRQPSLASLHEANNDSVWGELEMAYRVLSSLAIKPPSKSSSNACLLILTPTQPLWSKLLHQRSAAPITRVQSLSRMVFVLWTFHPAIRRICGNGQRPKW